MSTDPIVKAAGSVHRLIAQVRDDAYLTTAEKFAACAPLLAAENRILGVTGVATDAGCVSLATRNGTCPRLWERMAALSEIRTLVGAGMNEETVAAVRRFASSSPKGSEAPR